MAWEELVSRGLTVRPWDTPKPKCAYRRSLFSAALSKTLRLLTSELDHLHARNIVILLDVQEKDIRIDGAPRANAKMGEPCVAVSFDAVVGNEPIPLRYATGEFSSWQDNLRAIALSLEALRSVNRYGVANSGEQYRGWRAIPVSTDPADAIQTREQAVAAVWTLVSDRYTENDVEGASREEAVREAIRRTHPDTGGDATEFRKVLRARALLRA